MLLERIELDLENSVVDASRRELERFVRERAGESLTWAYFPGAGYPCCRALESELRKKLLPRLSGEFSLAFIRVATSKPVSVFGGLHVDVDVGVGHKRTTPFEIERMLVNLAGVPRIVEYVDDVAGLEIPRDEYKILTVPSERLKRMEIPPREDNAVWVLRFVSSRIPHTGITDERGHFLAAYGRYKEKRKL